MLHFNPIVERYSAEHLGEPLQVAEAAPVLLCTHARLEDHCEHAVARGTPLGALGAVPDGGERGRDGVARADANPVFARKRAQGEQRLAILH